MQVHWGYRDEVRDNYFSNAYLHAPGTHDSDVFIADKTSGTLVFADVASTTRAAESATKLKWTP